MFIPNHFNPYQCVICLENIACYQTIQKRIVYPKHESNVYITKCNHVYHNKCIKKWFEKNDTCPQCRTTTRHHTSNNIVLVINWNEFQSNDSDHSDLEHEHEHEHEPEIEVNNIIYKYNYFDNAYLVFIIYNVIQNIIHVCTYACLIVLIKSKPMSEYIYYIYICI